ncbi:MAG: hypothetical protein SWI22_12900 [Pseudomonadota bacterium]|nr:hypothetical protein [Pseudomonadota bacterium]
MSDAQHDFGAGGPVSNIVSTNGQRFLFANQSNDGSTMVVSVVRRLIVEIDNAEDIDRQFTYNDIAFLTKSLVNYLHKDIKLVKSLGNSTQFFSEELPPRDDSKKGIISDIRKAATLLAEVADVMEGMPVAPVDRIAPDDARSDGPTS